MAVKESKVAKVADIKEKLEKASSFLLIDYKGLSVMQDTELRNAYRENGVIYEVMKNRLLKIALKDMGYNQFDDALKGPTAVAMGTTDMVAPARIAYKKAKEYKKMKVKCGIVEGKYFDEESCKSLASLPSKEGLLSQVIGMFQAPIAGFARVINAIAEQKGA